ncbi:MAG: helix-hairpin-helix domain-containing protein [Nitrospiraceae bacterium]
MPGIGEARRKSLLRRFGSLEKIAEATDDQLREAGVNAKTAAELRKALG